MASIKNLQRLERAKEGQRIFCVAASDAPAFKQALWRAGYSWKTTAGDKVITFTITKKWANHIQ